jgi:hypothetical protein
MTHQADEGARAMLATTIPECLGLNVRSIGGWTATAATGGFIGVLALLPLR